MHFSVVSLTRPKRMAKALKKALAEAGHTFALSCCQNAVAQIYGRADWHHLTRSVDGVAQEDESPDRRAMRDSHGQTVLTSLGISPAVAASVLDLVRPTARNSKVVGLPALLVHIDVVMPSGLEKTVQVDVTAAALERLSWACTDPEQAVFGLEEHRHHRIVHLLPPQSLDTLFEGGRRGTIAARRQSEDWKAFQVQVGDLSDPAVVDAFRRRYRDLHWRKRRLVGAEKTLETVLSARFVKASETETRFVMTIDDWGTDRLCAPMGEEVYSGILYREYVETIEHRPSSGGAKEDAAWRDRFKQWEDRLVPPFAFATTPNEWRGMNPEWVREEAFNTDDGETIDPARFRARIREMIECDLQDGHHEDALEEIVEWSDLDFLADWASEAGTGSAQDLALEERFGAWNAKQHIVSYYRDEGTVVLLKPDGTKADAIEWCRRNVEREREFIDHLRRWSAPETSKPTTREG